MADEINKEKKFTITSEKIQILVSALGELPAKISYQALRILDSLEEIK
jgi:hypothetical protein